MKNHPILKGIDLTTMPPILGFNRVKPREGCPVIARWKNEGDPAIAVGQFGKGRVLAYTSDPAPHWGCNFVFWKQYAKLWTNAARWLIAGKWQDYAEAPYVPIHSISLGASPCRPRLAGCRGYRPGREDRHTNPKRRARSITNPKRKPGLLAYASG